MCVIEGCQLFRILLQHMKGLQHIDLYYVKVYTDSIYSTIHCMFLRLCMEQFHKYTVVYFSFVLSLCVNG